VDDGSACQSTSFGLASEDIDVHAAPRKEKSYP
jgi:hypothetical protein